MNVQLPVVDDPQPAAQVKSKWHRSEHEGKESCAGLSPHRAAIGLVNILHSMYSIVASVHFIQNTLSSAKQEKMCTGIEGVPIRGGSLQGM